MKTVDQDRRSKELDYTHLKVVVYNVDKFVSSNKITKLVETWVEGHDPPISIDKVLKPPKVTWIKITFPSEDMVNSFITLINGDEKKFTNKQGKPLFAKRATADDRDDKNGAGEKRPNENHNDSDGNNKRTKIDPEIKTDDEVRDALTPFWRKNYEDQLRKKQTDMIRKCSIKIIKEIKSIFKIREKEARRNEHTKKIPIFPWVLGKSAVTIEPCISSPSIYEYRNKVELTFGYLATTTEDKVPAVGYLASGWNGGISKPHLSFNNPAEACGIADIFIEFLKDSPMPPYDTFSHTGFWRLVTLRLSRRTNQCMLIIQHAPPSGGKGANKSENWSSRFESESNRLIGMLTTGPIPIPSPEDRGMPEGTKSDARKDMKVTSIFFQEYDGLSIPGPSHPVQHKYGSPVLEEKLGKCTFKISPGAFFQVNTECAELLYDEVVKKLRDVQSKKIHKTLLFDVCCGTGTIGLTCMKEGVVDQVIGIDISEPAIADAINNAKLNGYVDDVQDKLSSVKFIASRAESVLSKEITQAKHNKSDHTKIVAVVDPAREGLHPDVVRALCMHEEIERLVYVSCNPTGSLVKDAAMLCAPPTKRYPGLPFKITSAKPVDMFPLTSHCEMVMTFDRMTQEEYDECIASGSNISNTKISKAPVSVPEE